MMEEGSGLAGLLRLEPGLNWRGNCRRFCPASAGAVLGLAEEPGEDDSAGVARGEAIGITATWWGRSGRTRCPHPSVVGRGNTGRLLLLLELLLEAANLAFKLTYSGVRLVVCFDRYLALYLVDEKLAQGFYSNVFGL